MNPMALFTMPRMSLENDMLFAENPGMIGRAHRTRELYGRVTEIHLAFESKPVFADNHLDLIITTQP